MRLLHEQFLDAITSERERPATRRGVLTGSAAAAGVAGPALAAAPGAAAPASPNFANDLEVFNYALTLEHLEFAFYRDGLTAYAAAAFKAAGVADTVRPALEMVRDDEKAHVAAITAAIRQAGGTPVAEATYDFGYTDVAGFLKVAQALENTGVAAYHGAAPSITDKALLSAALGIHSVEARHAAYLNIHNDTTPFPDAFDPTKTRAEVLKIAGPLITGQAAAPAATAPAAATDQAAAAPSGTTTGVTIESFNFRPDSVSIAAGSTVTWTNLDTIVHTVTGDRGEFDSGDLSKGNRFSHTFATAGTFSYHCTYHSNMKASVTVR